MSLRVIELEMREAILTKPSMKNNIDFTPLFFLQEGT